MEGHSKQQRTCRSAGRKPGLEQSLIRGAPKEVGCSPFQSPLLCYTVVRVLLIHMAGNRREREVVVLDGSARPSEALEKESSRKVWRDGASIVNLFSMLSLSSEFQLPVSTCTPCASQQVGRKELPLHCLVCSMFGIIHERIAGEELYKANGSGQAPSSPKESGAPLIDTVQLRRISMLVTSVSARSCW